MPVSLSRRGLLGVGLLGGALLVGVRLPLRPARAAAAGPFTPNAFIRIDPQGAITFIMPDTEFGQGIYTSAGMLIAEELEVGLDQVAFEAAPPDTGQYHTALKAYVSPLLGEQATGGSTSIRGDWQRLRQAGAQVRTMLVAAAAQQWGVDPAACRAERAVVIGPDDKRAPYGTFAAAAAAQPVPDKLPLKPSSAFKLIGHSQPRVDTPAKVDGSLVFGIDVRVPGMKVGTVLACPVIGGRLRSVDEAAAKRVPGVRDVVRLDDAVAVIGDHFWAAKQGLAALDPQWDEGKHARLQTADIIGAQEKASQRDPEVIAKDEGDAPAAIKAAAKTVSAAYQLPFLSHAPMEPVNATLHVRPDGADLWVGTQVPARARDTVAKVTGLRPETVQVHNHLMGGAFGRRLDVDFITQAAAIAKQVPYPVKIVWTREEDIQHDLLRPYYYDRLSAGLDAQGRITGWTHHGTGASVMARWQPKGMQKDGKLDPDTIEGATETPYAIPAMRVGFTRVEPPGITTAWWRGVGATHNVFMVESFMDELAFAAGKDPIAFRRDMIGDNARARAVLDLVAEKSGWGRKLPKGVGQGVSLQLSFGSFLAHVLEVEVTPRGEVRLRRAVVAVDCGTVVQPDGVVAQIEGGLIFGLSAALYNEITVQDGRVQQSNFNNYRVLRIDEAPRIEVHMIRNDEGPGGIGETGTVAAAPALVNAIHAATGKRLRRLPIGTQLVGA
ncbi:MAG: aldehyde dehydrogenase [Rhodospirillales bacterium 69-11]|nr:xanthine dehydrogenase family protein molybdopterin-binding subunit [Rhodospirillales bacterium]OJW25622.1 MAG: aldehyde dehydrogenase [Rhodospirillales bacterium 69-11]